MAVGRTGLVSLFFFAAACSSGSGVDGGVLDASGDVGVLPDLGTDAGVDGGPTCTIGMWDPAAGTIDEWPDARLVVADATTDTGHRLHIDATRFAPTIEAAGVFSSTFSALEELDGFGVNAQAFFRFGRPWIDAMLPTAEATETPSGGVGFVVLSGGTPRLEGALLSTAPDGTLFLAPLHPLPANATVAAYVTRALTPAAGGCLEPSPATAALLAAPDADATLALDALHALGVTATATDVVALTVFPTQTTTGDSEAVAADVDGRTFHVAGAPVCTAMPTYRQCELSFEAGDYMDASHHVPLIGAGGDASPQSTYTLKVSVWLPLTGTPPFRTVVYGHGLGSGREQGAVLAGFAAPAGVATVAIDAVMHGEHPLNPDPSATTLNTVLGFFAIDLASTTMPFDARALRDHFRQSSYDKLQLAKLLQGGVDADGDGTVDLDPTRLGYLGVSLGGIMGPEPLSLTDAFGVAVLVVPGGRVSAIVSDSATFAPVILALRPRGTTPSDVARFFPVLQTILDRGDAASYGPHVLADRLVPGGSHLVPSTMLGVVLDDDTVPNVCNFTLARAMGVSVVPPLLRAEPGLVTTAMPAPLSGNLDSGNATAGLLQFDVIREDDGTTVSTATHSNVGDSTVGAHAWFHFLTTHWDDGLAEIEDPYLATSLMHRM